ncbi:MAG TPA: nuclear transport factor 2 family protein [Polyangiaceae bacterium]
MNPHTDQTEQTQRTVNNHLQSFSRGDVDAIMADYAERAVFYTPDGALRGKAAIRAFFEQLLLSFPPGSTFEITKQIFDANLAYLVWAGESQKLRIPLATDTILLENGRIVQQTFAAQIHAKVS